MPLSNKKIQERYDLIQDIRRKARWNVVWLILDRDKYIDETNDKEVTDITHAWKLMDRLFVDIIYDRENVLSKLDKIINKRE